MEEVSDPARLTAYRGQWDALVARCADASMFDTFEWVTAWIEAFWAGRLLCFLFFWTGDVLEGIAPLLADEHGDVWCSSSMVCPVNRHGNRASVISAGNAAAICGAMLAYLQQSRQHVRLAFRNVLAGAPVFSALPATAAAAGMSSLVFPSVSSPIVRIAGDWPSYLKSRSSHLAKEVKRKVKRLQDAGRVEIEMVSRGDDFSRTMGDILRIEERSWKAERKVSLDLMQGPQRLYETFARAATGNGLLRSYVLYLDSKPVVYLYGVTFRNEYYALRTAYDSEYGKLSPGVVLFDRVLRDAFEEKREVVDFGPGDESRWKHDFANDVRAQVNVCVFSPWSVRCRCCGACEHRVKPFLKKHAPVLVKMRDRLCPKV
ncbi:MAG TPA: GNAT family N-acetyltransferase [Thermoguttaceae bacterium]|nr:GNAT family N-acetyltransferase [Thermoguttaceae bacterium]